MQPLIEVVNINLADQSSLQSLVDDSRYETDPKDVKWMSSMDIRRKYCKQNLQLNNVKNKPT